MKKAAKHQDGAAFRLPSAYPPKRFFPMKANLTAKIVPTLTLPEGKDDEIYWDEKDEGFGHRLRRSGDKVNHSWVVQYRHAGQSRRMALKGILTSEQARDEAKKILANSGRTRQWKGNNALRPTSSASKYWPSDTWRTRNRS
jgi:hypothetical protein